MANRIVVMHDGLVEQVGAPLDLYDFPASIFVAGFIGSPTMNFADGVVQGGKRPKVRLANGALVDVSAKLPLRDGHAVTIGMRPEHLFFADKGIAGQVLVLEPLGMSTQVTIDVMGERLALLTLDRPTFTPGDPVHLAIASSNVHVFDKVSGSAIR